MSHVADSFVLWLNAADGKRPVQQETVRDAGSMRGGHAQVRIFDPRLSGVDYVAKCLGYGSDGADVYESAKFGMDGRELMYSRAVWNEANHFRRRADR